MIYDTFPFNDELDILECRLTELEGIDELIHVLVEAPVNHQGAAKPLWYAEHRSRFSRWNHRIIHVIAEGLPSAQRTPDPWAREHAQREYARLGLHEAESGDIVLHGDADEIPRVTAVTADPGGGMLGTEMRHHIFAIDWLHPEWFRGTVSTRAKNITSFAALRGMRNSIPLLKDAGWHLTCLGGPDAIRKKLDSFCHLEMRGMLERGLAESRFYEEGWAWGPPPASELGGVRMRGVDVDAGWPRWIRDGKAPALWYRPRPGEVRISEQDACPEWVGIPDA